MLQQVFNKNDMPMAAPNHPAMLRTYGTALSFLFVFYQYFAPMAQLVSMPIKRDNIAYLQQALSFLFVSINILPRWRSWCRWLSSGITLRIYGTPSLFLFVFYQYFAPMAQLVSMPVKRDNIAYLRHAIALFICFLPIFCADGAAGVDACQAG